MNGILLTRLFAVILRNSTKFGCICWKRRHFLLCERNYRNLWQPKGLFHSIFNDALKSLHVLRRELKAMFSSGLQLAQR